MRPIPCIERGGLGFVTSGLWFGCNGCGFRADGHWRIAKGNSNAATTTPPEPGEMVELEGWRLEVVAMDRLRIATVRIVAPAEEADS
jgi:hypothetical protein